MMPRALLLIIVSAVTLHAQGPDVDTFTFRDGVAGPLTVTLEEANDTIAMTWPATAGRAWDTALLGVQRRASTSWVGAVRRDRVGRCYRPSVFSSGRDRPTLAQPEFSARLRSPAARASASAPTACASTVGAAPLRLFANGLDLSRTMLVLAPHPDDAEIAAFGVYANRNATIVTITTGNAGPRSYEAVSTTSPRCITSRAASD